MSQGLPEHLPRLFDTRRRDALRLAACFGMLGVVTTWFLASVLGVGDEAQPVLVGTATAGVVATALGFAVGSRSIGRRGEYGILLLATMGAGALTGGLFAVAVELASKPMGSISTTATLMFGGGLLGTFTALAFFAGPIAIVYRSHVATARARSRSLVDRANRQRVWFTTFAILFAGLILPIKLDHWADEVRTVLRMIFGGALAALCVASAVRSVRFAVAARHFAASESEVVDLAENEVDLGVGNECNVRNTVQPNPYRSAPRVTTVLRGSILTTRRILFSLLRVDGAVVILGFVASLHPFADKPRSLNTSTLPPVTQMPQPADHRQLSFYPQTAPIVFDVNGDGVEDVIGLSWDPSHSDAALDAVAVSGGNMRPLWRSPAIRSQWSSPRTRLVMSGDRLFLTDSESLLHIIDAHDGSERIVRPIPASGDAFPTMCAAPNAPARVWIAVERQSPTQKGISVYADGKETEDQRPEWCTTTAKYPRCGDLHVAGTCASDKLVPWRDGVASGSLEESESDAGVAFGASKGSSHLNELVGFDAPTGKSRFELPVAFDDGPLHVDPNIQHALRGGRIFSAYQKQNGHWLVGARDARSGRALWYKEAPSTDRGTNFKSLFASATRLYAMVDWQLRVFDGATGNQLGTMF